MTDHQLKRTVEEVEKAYAQYRKEKRGYEPAGTNADVLFLLDEIERMKMKTIKITNSETALAHLEAFIAGGDELGDVSEDDALEALEYLRKEIKRLEKIAKGTAIAMMGGG